MTVLAAIYNANVDTRVWAPPPRIPHFCKTDIRCNGASHTMTIMIGANNYF